MLQKTYPLNVQINVYIFSIINKGLMDSKVAQKYKIDNHYSNINHVYTMFKGDIMLITEV